MFPKQPLPVYEVEFIPFERRLRDRRVAPPDTPLPIGLKEDRRKSDGRRMEDHSAVHLELVQ